MRLSGPNLVDLLTAISHYLKIVIPDVISQLFQSYLTVAVENYRLVELRLGISVELLKYLETLPFVRTVDIVDSNATPPVLQQLDEYVTR